MLNLFEITAALLVLSALFGWINHRFVHLPHTIGLLVMALAASLALTGAFSALLVYIGSSLLLFNALTIGTVFVIRRRGLTNEGDVFRTPLHPLPAIVFIGITLAAWINGLVGAPVPTGAALGTLTLGAGIYFAGRRLGWFTRLDGHAPVQ